VAGRSIPVSVAIASALEGEIGEGRTCVLAIDSPYLVSMAVDFRHLLGLAALPVLKASSR
jgi:hypothetical protein